MSMLVFWLVTPCGLVGSWRNILSPSSALKTDTVCSTTGIRFPAGTVIFVIATVSKLVLGPTQTPVKHCVDCFLWVKASEAWSWPLTSNYCRRCDYIEIYLLSSFTLVYWHRDNFTFTRTKDEGLRQGSQTRGLRVACGPPVHFMRPLHWSCSDYRMWPASLLNNLCYFLL
jgi:hypothetical protein